MAFRTLLLVGLIAAATGFYVFVGWVFLSLRRIVPDDAGKTIDLGTQLFAVIIYTIYAITIRTVLDGLPEAARILARAATRAKEIVEIVHPEGPPPGSSVVSGAKGAILAVFSAEIGEIRETTFQGVPVVGRDARPSKNHRRRWVAPDRVGTPDAVFFELRSHPDVSALVGKSGKGSPSEVLEASIRAIRLGIQEYTDGDAGSEQAALQALSALREIQERVNIDSVAGPPAEATFAVTVITILHTMVLGFTFATSWFGVAVYASAATLVSVFSLFQLWIWLLRQTEHPYYPLAQIAHSTVSALG